MWASRILVAADVHVWSAELDSPSWPGAEGLPPGERERAARILNPRRARRWTAARWALRRVLSHYLGAAPTEIELASAEGGKPALAASPLHFNLSHSHRIALVAVATGREVGVDVEWIDPRRPTPFYLGWTRREAAAKCCGGGLWSPPPPDRSVTVANIEAAAGFAAALAVEALPRLNAA